MTTPDLTPSGGWKTIEAAQADRLRHWISAGQPPITDLTDKAYFRRDIEDLIRSAEWNRRATPPDAITTDTQDDREALRERVARIISTWPYYIETHEDAREVAEAILAALPLQEREG